MHALLLVLLVLQGRSRKVYLPHQTAFIHHLTKSGRTIQTADCDDVYEFLLLWSCDYENGVFVVNKGTKSAFASARSAISKLFVDNKLQPPYDKEFLRIVHRSIKLQCAKYKIAQAPPLGCFDLRRMITKLLNPQVRKNACHRLQYLA